MHALPQPPLQLSRKNNTPSSLIQQRLKEISTTIPQGVTLVAVSKFHPIDAIAEAYRAGQRVFGESRLQELEQKMPALPDDICWHFIGHLQTNKVRRLVAMRPALIESVDSERLLRLIDSESERLGVTTRVLLQVHVAREETKFGFYPDELIDLFNRRVPDSLRATRICGIMGMASNTTDEARVRADFAAIAETRRRCLELIASPDDFTILSMGMSGDYTLAIAEGSTMVRIGSAIFGDRQY